MTHSAKLVWITPEAEKIVSYCARVSNPANQENYDTADKLIRYCIKHGHWSVFEMVNMCVEIETTRSIAAQILRHRSFSFQEFSQRYAQPGQLGTAMVPDLRLQDLKNRQNSISPEDPSEELYEFSSEIAGLFEEAEDLYRRMVEYGVARECAREVLPLSTPTRLYMNGTIRSWLHYCELRTGNGTQREHALIAAQIQDILYKELPSVCAGMWEENG
jgi:thymidylate synthase (FAD)